jgi:glutaredoxin
MPSVTRDRESRIRRARKLLWIAFGLSLIALALARGPAWYYDPRRSNGPTQVIVYTTSWCPVCERLRGCLRGHGVPYEERDVERSFRADREYSALGGFGVPLTLAGQQIAHGMRRQELQSALATAGYRVDCWGQGPAKDDPSRR